MMCLGSYSGQRSLNHISKGNQSSEVLNFLCRWKSAKILYFLETAFSFFINEFLNNNTECHIKAFLLIFHPVSSKSRNQTPANKKQWKLLPVQITVWYLLGHQESKTLGIYKQLLHCKLTTCPSFCPRLASHPSKHHTTYWTLSQPPFGNNRNSYLTKWGWEVI